jgi:membrane associated rhomboid family serine protease
MIPIGTDRPQRRIPWMNILLIGINVVVFLLSHQFAPPHPGEASPSDLHDWWSHGILASSPHLYQFITYQFLHANFMHLAGNMLFLYVFGNNLNEKLGHASYLIFYLAGGILAGCGQLLTSGAPTLGASGSISAVTGLFFVLLPRTHIRIFFIFFYVADVFEIPSMYVIAFNVLKDFLEPLFAPGGHVAYQAHLTGTFSGVLIGLILLLGGLVQRDHYDLLAMINRYRRRRAYESLVAGGYNFYTADAPVPPPSKVRRTEATDARVFDLRERVFAALRARDLPAASAAYLELRKFDPAQVLPMQEQLDVANQLMSETQHPEAAAAYEDYLRVYPRGNQHEQVQLILGMIYANYLPNPARATELLRAAAARLHSPAERQLAESELARLAASSAPPGASDPGPAPSPPGR